MYHLKELTKELLKQYPAKTQDGQYTARVIDSRIIFFEDPILSLDEPRQTTLLPYEALTEPVWSLPEPF